MKIVGIIIAITVIHLTKMFSEVSGVPGITDWNKLEKNLLEIHDKWIICTTDPNCKDYSALTEDFAKQLIIQLQLDTTSYQYSFPQLTQNNIIRIFHTKDGNLKIYNWNVFSKNRAQYTYTLFQWKTTNGIKSYDPNLMPGKVIGEPQNEKLISLYPTQIGNSNVYILNKVKIDNSYKIIQELEAVTIIDDRITRQFPIFKTSNEITGIFRFSFIHPYENLTLEENTDALLKNYNEVIYKENNQNIYIPIIKDKLLTPEHNIFVPEGNYYKLIHTH